MKYFYDCEFEERGNNYPIKPISIGMVREDGEEFYAELPFIWSYCKNQWLHENVKPNLKTLREGSTGLEISGQLERNVARDLIAWVGQDKPELWGYYSDYDHVVLCQLFGTMVDLPQHWPKYTLDIKQIAFMLGNPELPDQISTEHDALEDARWNKLAWEWLYRCTLGSPFEKVLRVQPAGLHGELI